MGWVFFQVFLAFGMGVLIVWWTWPRNERPDAKADESTQIAGSEEK